MENNLLQMLIFAVVLAIIIQGLFHFWHLSLHVSSTNNA
jgi:hypothetical protein